MNQAYKGNVWGLECMSGGAPPRLLGTMFSSRGTSCLHWDRSDEASTIELVAAIVILLRRPARAWRSRHWAAEAVVERSSA